MTTSGVLGLTSIEMYIHTYIHTYIYVAHYMMYTCTVQISIYSNYTTLYTSAQCMSCWLSEERVKDRAV